MTIRGHFSAAPGKEKPARAFGEGQDREWAKGFEDGVEKGYTAGYAMGKREMLLQLMDLRFGPLPEEVDVLVRYTKPGDISDLATQFWQAESLRDFLW